MRVMVKLFLFAHIGSNPFRSYLMLPCTKQMDAFFRNARCSFRFAFSFRSRSSSALSDSVTAVCRRSSKMGL